MLSYLIKKVKNGLNFLFQRSHKKLYYLFLRLVINKRDLCIISNNCYGGDFYQGLKLPYNTPTVGLFFIAEDYIEFLSNLKFYLVNAELEFVEKSRHFEEFKDYPIGLLGGKVEIHFLHYQSNQEAKDKWQRRKERINWDNLFIMWNDQNQFKDELLPLFLKLPYSKKVFFSAKQRIGNDVIWLKRYQNQECVPDLIQKKFIVWHYFNFAKWFNQGA